MIAVHPRTYQSMRNIASLIVELGERAARELFDDSFVMAAGQLIIHDWRLRWQR